VKKAVMFDEIDMVEEMQDDEDFDDSSNMGYSQTTTMENQRKLPTRLQLPQRYSDLIQFQSFIDCSMNILTKNDEVFMFEKIRRMVTEQSGK
jgi:hypothetical protein|tara:strand:- start:180 stop:455 length:276 start_codon:yes stop_codon:yes gene_type:complete